MSRRRIAGLLIGVVVGSIATGASAQTDRTAAESTTSTTLDAATNDAGTNDAGTNDAGVDGRYRGFGDGGGFLNLLPPGQNSGVTSATLGEIQAALAGDGEFPAHYEDQLRLYDALVQADELTDARLTDYFKDASFGVTNDDIGRVYRPHDDVTVIRDESFGVAHIYGRTRYATMYAQGYTSAEDRMFFMDVLRHVGRGRLAELIGYSDDFAGRDRDTVGSSPYTEADLQAQVDELANSGPEGAAILADVEAYADGVNSFIEEIATDPTRTPVEYTLLQTAPQPWIPEDAVAIATLVGGIFGRGGGREVANACGLQRLRANLDGDADAARTIFDDLHFVDAADSPTTGSDVAPYALARPDAPDPAANPEIDCTSLVPISDASPRTDDLAAGLGATTSLLASDGRFAPTVAFLDALARARRDGVHLSNAILVAGDRTAAGRPIAVFGPQIGYSAPELLTEKDVHGPGIDARGVGFLGVDLYVLLGRGDRYAWSATSSGADNVDQVLLRLCDPAGGAATTASKGYERNGDCVEIESWEHVLDAPATALAPEARTVAWQVERSEYGPLLFRGTLLDGVPIAVAEHRTTYGREITSAVGFKQLNDPDYMAGGVDAFRRATGEGIDYTFNWFYVDDRDIAFQDSCRCPVRAADADPTMPVLAGAGFDWTGEFLDAADLPHAVDPESGYLVSWNNRPAPGWGSSDAEFDYGPVHRSLLLSRAVERRLAADETTEPSVTRADLVAIMRDGATQDLRGVEVLPLLLEVMGEAPAGIDARVLDLRERLEIWADGGAFRRDADGDGAYEDAVAPAVIDAWWPRVVDAIFADDGDARAALDLGLGGLDNPSGSAGHVVRALRPGDHPFTYAYCADGCAPALWDSLATTVGDLETEFGSPDVADWERTVADDEIHYATLLAGMPTIDWQNRPTFQQVVQLETGSDRPEPSDGDLPTTTAAGAGDAADGGGSSAIGIVVGAGVLALIIGGALLRQRRRRRRD